MRERSRPPVELVSEPGGAPIYHVRLSAADLPPVRSGDLADAWAAAGRAAAAGRWGEPCLFRFRPADGTAVDLALRDDDAACWAEAVERHWSLASPYGLSLCLRLLALVALLSHSASLRTLCPVSRAGARLDPALVRAAATAPLSEGGHLDERVLLAHLALPIARQRSSLHWGVPT